MSIHNSPKFFWIDVNKQVKALLRRKERAVKPNYIKALRHFKRKAAICSQCKRAMLSRTANIQIENKRENAPICVACILGYKRKPLKKYK